MSLDPLGHIKIAAGNFEKSAAFYEKLFWRLGFEKIHDTAWRTKEGFGIWITQAKEKQTYVFQAPGLHHLCVKAEAKTLVDDIYTFLTEEGVTIFDPPQSYPEYTKDYYAVFFADPDGIKLEVAYY